jgi:hypothetical protein
MAEAVIGQFQDFFWERFFERSSHHPLSKFRAFRAQKHFKPSSSAAKPLRSFQLLV